VQYRIVTVPQHAEQLVFPIGLVVVIAFAVSALAFIVKSIADGVVRYQAASNKRLDTDTEQRLARIESSIEAVALETERIGELLRFSAQLQAERQPLGESQSNTRRLGAPESHGRTITPH